MAAQPQTPLAESARAEALRRHEDAIGVAELLDREPPCTCQQTDVDLFDARGCELHDESSAWNTAYRAVTVAERYYEAMEDTDECPF